MRMITRPMGGFDSAANFGAPYRTIWRWHAGLFCWPLIIMDHSDPDHPARWTLQHRRRAI
ncbi:MAG TPA: hypothetical protein VL996_02240 [Methylocella sp.]|nr:hypothetical protein [Methylocella sp.]